ncbi:MAG: DUF4238 domain-containing protein [Clostridia bacterium]|nr:DUF4238 domain-containing protein [Clostridia bacterium]
MVNSHYIPQFILRNFCADNKIQYYNKHTKALETRSTRSVFSEKGYYPDELEKDLCHKIEYQFSVVLNNKIIKARNTITLNYEDMWILKKFLIITMLRVHDDDMAHNVWYRFLKRDGWIRIAEEFNAAYSGDFYENIQKILNCPDPVTALEIAKTEPNLNLFSFVRDVINSYNVFVKTGNAKENFVMPDRGWANYCGIIAMKKINAIMNMPIYPYEPFLQELIEKSSPQDYAVFPLSSNLALVEVSPIILIMQPGSPYRIKFPPEAPTLAKCMGFGSNKVFAPPKKQMICGTKLYTYDIHPLPAPDVVFLNSLLIENADSFVGFAEYDKVRQSFEQSGCVVSP